MSGGARLPGTMVALVASQRYCPLLASRVTAFVPILALFWANGLLSYAGQL